MRQGVIGTKRKPALAMTTVAVPLRVTVWGEVAASSEIFSVAVRLPEAIGENVIENAQLALAASVAGQVVATENSVLLGPVMLTPTIGRG